MSENKKPLSLESKRKLIFFPVVGILASLFLYFTIFYGKNDKAVMNNGLDYDLPQGEKQELPNEKLKVISEYDKYERNKNKASSFSEFSDVVTMKKEAPEEFEKKETTNEAVKRIQDELRQKEKIQREKNINASRVQSNTNYRQRSKVPSKKEIKEEWKNETKNEFNDFFSVDNSTSINRNKNNSNKDVINNSKFFEAYVSGDQELTDGDILEMRLSNDYSINGNVFKSNTTFYGTVKFKKKRILISINNINHKPVSLKVYDKKDGNIGDFFKAKDLGGNISDIATDEAINNIETGNGLLNTGVNSVKTLVKKKNNTVKINILNSTKLILK